MQRKVALIHASPAAIAPLMQFYGEAAPELEVTNLLDDGLLRLFRSGDEAGAEGRLAEMIGTQRQSVSLALSQFKDDRLISYSRGRIQIHDREGLLERACGCISVMHDEERRLRDGRGV